MYLSPSTHDQSSRPERLPRNKNSPFPLFSDSEYSVGKVSGDALDREREWRDTPPLDRLSADRRRDTNKSKAALPIGDEEVPAENLDGDPLRE